LIEPVHAPAIDCETFAMQEMVEPRLSELCDVPFGAAIIERFRCREWSVEEALVEIYTDGVSVRRVEDITETRSSGSDRAHGRDA
jgi:hypothetical protein